MNTVPHTYSVRVNYRILAVAVFAIAFAFVETSVVVYLRDLYYPNGFEFPLKTLPASRVAIELAREFSTMIMLAVISILAGRKRWERFGYFALAFGIWDLFYYVWLKVAINWPSSLLDWDILFLIPVPWIGPVIAPMLVSLLMIVCGYLIIHLQHRNIQFTPDSICWALALLATAAILWSFMKDSSVVITQRMPGPYSFVLLYIGLVLYVAGFLQAYRRSLRRADSKN